MCTNRCLDSQPCQSSSDHSVAADLRGMQELAQILLVATVTVHTQKTALFSLKNQRIPFKISTLEHSQVTKQRSPFAAGLFGEYSDVQIITSAQPVAVETASWGTLRDYVAVVYRAIQSEKTR